MDWSALRPVRVRKTHFAAAFVSTLILVGSAGFASALPFSNLIVFGDSIVDAGNVATVFPAAVPSPPYSNGRFTNGPTIADYVNREIEGTDSVASLQGGDNYAWGGARARADGDVPGLASQVGSYLLNTGGAVDSNALYMINIGGNDVRDIFLSGQSPQIVIPDVVAAVLSQVTLLQSLGAQNFLFVGVGDVGALPELGPFGPFLQRLATNSANFMTQSIREAIEPLGATVFDSIDFFNSALSNPADFGLPADLNITDACTNALPADFPTCEGFAFLDTVHPTDVVHEVWGDAIIAAVPEPGTAILLSLGLIGLASRREARS